MKKIKNYINNLNKKIKNHLNKLNRFDRFILVYNFIFFCVLFYNFKLIFLLIFVILKLFLYLRNKKLINDLMYYASSNIIIFGGRGKGKSLLTNIIANNCNHISNVPFNSKSENLDIKDYITFLNPNTFQNILNNSIIKKESNKKYFKKTVIIDDIPIFFNNIDDLLLKKLYPNVHLTLSISRHLFDNNNIIITQDLGRSWKPIRELQSDYYIKVVNTSMKNKNIFKNVIKFIPFFNLYDYVDYIVYDNYNSAESGLLPFSVGLIDKSGEKIKTSVSAALRKQFESSNGLVLQKRVYFKKSEITYNTRYFASVFLEKK